MKEKDNINAFNDDITNHGQYIYTDINRLSVKVVNERFLKFISDIINLQDKTIIDIGCGDGTMSNELLMFNPKLVIGIDAAGLAIENANINFKSDVIKFMHVNVYDMSNIFNEKFDVAIIQRVLHHLPDPKKAIEEAMKIADYIIIIEPNGYNPILKIIEKTSKYHIEHEDMSYPPYLLNRWVNKLGCTIIKRKYFNLVPIFSPDWFVRILLFFQPLVEVIPLIRNISCGLYGLLIKSNTSPSLP